MNTEKPEPPEGYRLLTEEEKRQVLPTDAIIYSVSACKWCDSGRRGEMIHPMWARYSYATRAPISASEKPTESPEKDAEIARLREDYERLQNQLRLCEEHAGTMAVDFDKGVEVMRADIATLRAQLTAKDAIIRELKKLLEENLFSPIFGNRGKGEVAPVIGVRCNSCRNEALPGGVLEHDSDCWMTTALTRAKENQPEKGDK